MFIEQERCKKLVDLIINSPSGKVVVLSIIPHVGLDSKYIAFHEANDNVEIGMSKSFYISVFKEAHDFWHTNHDEFAQLVSSAHINDSKLVDDMFYMTFGYLLTTPGNSSIINMHEQLLWQKLRVDQNIADKDFKIICTLLSSRLKRINKNSLLYHLLKKFVVVLVFAPLLQDLEDVTMKFEILLKTVNTSSELHYSNYYASSFMKWCIRMLFVLSRLSLNDTQKNIVNHLQIITVNTLLATCHEHLSDLSLWSSIEVFCMCDLSRDTYILNAINDYNNTVLGLQKHGIQLNSICFELNSCFKPLLAKDFLMNEIKWLLKVRCKYIKTYYCLLRPLKMSESFDIVELQEAFSNILQTFDHSLKENGKIGISSEDPSDVKFEEAVSIMAKEWGIFI